ncbi:hypothetical protein J4216_03155, partial [Candidatus Woesearchaeota archaeon]|nr:hypothetical protein [Candidatus Woesearchaeota archaeon]
MSFIKWLKNISKKDVSIAGGKGASLGEMINSKIQVPNGFVIISSTFDDFIKRTSIKEKIDSILLSLDHNKIDAIENAAEKIQALILNIEIPKSLEQEVLKNFKKLKTKYVAVRSSATSEDSSTAAWAGQLETYLNTTEKYLIKNIKKCWASLFTPRAIFYRFENKLNDEKISVAVIVQKMINSDISGVAFSVHPVTQDHNQLIIEAGYGLGEAIVSGQITPDSYIIQKNKMSIIDKNIHDQNRGLFRNKNGGNEWRNLGPNGKTQVLSDKEIIKLAKIIKKIEDHYKFPVDIEWAKEKNKFYITQSRPITTLKNQERKTLYKKFMNRSFSLIACQYWDLGERKELSKICENKFYFTPMFIHNKGKGISVYYDCSNILQDPKSLVEYFNNKEKKFDKLAREYLVIANKLKSNKNDLSQLYNLIVKFWVMLTINNLLGKSDSINKTIGKKAYKLRADTDQVLYN